MSKIFLVTFGIMALAGVVLILSIPPLFDAHEPYQEQLTGWAAGVFVVFTVIVLIQRLAKRHKIKPTRAR